MGNRKQYENMDCHYSLATGERGEFCWLCVYCGVPADTLDHVPPISRYHDYMALPLGRHYAIKVPACRVCNSLAADSLQETFLERVEHVKNKISKRYWKYVKPMEEWEDWELDELGPNLRSAMMKDRKKRKIYTDMIEYYYGVDKVLEHLDG